MADADTETLQLLPNLRVCPVRGPQLALDAMMQGKYTMYKTSIYPVLIILKGSILLSVNCASLSGYSSCDL